MSKAIMLASYNLFYPLTTILYSLRKYASEDCQLIIFQFEMSTEQKSLLKKAFNAEVIEYKPFDFDIPQTFMAFARFEAFKLIKTFDQILYLDCDVLIRKNIDDVFKYDQPLCATYGEPNFWMNFRGKYPDYKYKSKFDDIFFNSGVFLFNSSLRSYADKIYSWSYETLKTGLSRGDQGILNLIPYVFDIKITDFTAYYNSHYYLIEDKKCQDPAIVHYSGTQIKPYFKESVIEKKDKLHFYEEYAENILKTMHYLEGFGLESDWDNFVYAMPESSKNYSLLEELEKDKLNLQ